MKFVVRTLVISAAAAVAISTAYAQSASIAKRQNILKGWGDATKPVAAMLKGEAAYDGAAVQKALAAYSTGAKELVALFPDDSKTGGDTAALPGIWNDKAKFTGIYDKLAAESTAAAAAIKDEASMKANFPKVLGNCKACHDDFRQKKS